MKLGSALGLFESASVNFRHHYPTERTTFATILYVKNGQAVSLAAFANCHAGDNYCRETGRKMAFRNAIKREPRVIRAALWAAFHSARGKYGFSSV